MISTNALSALILHHHLNGLGNKNLCSIQEIMHASEWAAAKYKKVCEDLLNLAILIKSATPGKVQLISDHAIIGNKSLGESVVAFTLAGYQRSPSFVSLKMDIAFSIDSDKIRIPIAEVRLCADARNLARSKK